VRLANDVLIIHLRLIQSALGQKVEAKPLGVSQRERSQGCAVMGSRVVAGLPGEMELHLGWNLARATSFLAKFGQSASIATGRGAAEAVSGVSIVPVVQAITWRTGNVRFTDEVPRRPAPHGQVTLGYKSDTKGLGHASEAGRVSPQPRPKGCQQRQSRGIGPRRSEDVCSERQNLRVPSGSLRFMGPVSPTHPATKWPDQTSAGQWGGSLSNSPQQPEPGQVALRSR
jgi:hypothetical protein